MSFTPSSSAYLKIKEVYMLRSLFQKGQSAVSAMWSSKYYLPVLLIMAGCRDGNADLV